MCYREQHLPVDSLLLVDSLRPYRTYQCTIAAFTIAIGPEAIAEATTFQEGNHLTRLVRVSLIQYYRYFSAPNESPRNAAVTVLDSTRVECSWLPPLAEEVNGIVTGFIIRITGQDSDETIEVRTNATNIQVEDLHPFYSYVFTVAAVTEAGSGPFSRVAYFQMFTAGKQLIKNSQCCITQMLLSCFSTGGFC